MVIDGGRNAGKQQQTALKSTKTKKNSNKNTTTKNAKKKKINSNESKKKSSGPTSPQEIARQHQLAQSRIDTTPCAPCVDRGEIPLSHKQPHSLSLLGEEAIVTWSSRGRDIDVTALQTLVRVGYNNNDGPDSTTQYNYWDPTNAAKDNVAIFRPSHDAWGIRKIVLLFCDDFCWNRFEMPWWSTFQPALEPILQCLGLSSTESSNSTTDNSKNGTPNARLVRVLLASLPPNTTIPIHQDSGSWVHQTHRVHIPILVPNDDPNQIYFTIHNQVRIDCTPGHVFEINNCLSHAVSNCSSTDWRVHLILDYTDSEQHIGNDNNDKALFIPPCLLQNYDRPRTLLLPGQILHQTRRSVDCSHPRQKNISTTATSLSLRPTPTFVILGAQKCGTTSLFELLQQHAWIVRPQNQRRETHAFDWNWKEFDGDVKRQCQHVLSYFYTDQLSQHPSCCTGDSTPSYLLDSTRVIERITSVYKHYRQLKFFIMLRDPVQRVQSHYAMVTSPNGTPAQLKARGTAWKEKPIEQVIREEMQVLKQIGLIPYFDVDTGTVDWNEWESFVNSPAEQDAFEKYQKDYIPQGQGSHSILVRGLYALQIRSCFQHGDSKTTRTFDKNQFLILNLDDGFGRAVMDRVWQHLEVPPMPYMSHFDVDDSTNDDSQEETKAENGGTTAPPKGETNKQQEQARYNARDYLPSSPDIIAYLQRFYGPHNQRLCQLLGWNPSDTWKYQHHVVANK